MTEGYGLNRRALEELAEQSDLLVTVDCGIASVADVAAVQGAGKLDIIITDHHLPGSELPPACAVLNPHRADCPYPDKDLAGVGVAFKLCQALAAVRSGKPWDASRPSRMISSSSRSARSQTSCRCAGKTAASSSRAWPAWRRLHYRASRRSSRSRAQGQEDHGGPSRLFARAAAQCGRAHRVGAHGRCTLDGGGPSAGRQARARARPAQHRAARD